MSNTNKCKDCINLLNNKNYNDVCVYYNTRRDPERDSCDKFEAKEELKCRIAK